jgi:nucleoside transporter
MATATHRIPLLRTRLSVQMFLQFATWGVWVPVLGNHLAGIGIAPEKIGLVYATGPLALMIAPLIAGQIADRWFATQRFLALCYLVSAVLFWLLATATDIDVILQLALASMLFFGPTLGLANALCFRHLADGERDFPLVRVWGTIGWIAAGWALYAWMGLDQRHGFGDSFYLAAVFAALNGFYALTLPHTPPKGGADAPLPLGKVLGMLKDPSFAVFVAAAFATLVFASFYYNCVGLFFEKGLGVEGKYVSLLQGIGQVTEIGTMFLLPLALRRLGFKTTIAMGIAAWGLRFACFALGTPKELMIAAQALHGVCIAFTIATAMIYADRICAPEIRGTVQSFLAFVTYGVGMELGALLAARVSGACTGPAGTLDWHALWLVPAVGCAGVLALFLIGFKARALPVPAPAPAPADAASA